MDGHSIHNIYFKIFWISVDISPFCCYTCTFSLSICTMVANLKLHRRIHKNRICSAYFFIKWFSIYQNGSQIVWMTGIHLIYLFGLCKQYLVPLPPLFTVPSYTFFLYLPHFYPHLCRLFSSFLSQASPHYNHLLSLPLGVIINIRRNGGKFKALALWMQPINRQPPRKKSP